MMFWSKTFWMFKQQRLSGSIISEIIRVGYSSFVSKCFKFHGHFRNEIKNCEKVFCFWDNSLWNCCRKFCIFRREYLAPAVNVLANRLKISDRTKADFFPAKFTLNSLENRIIVLRCRFHECLEPVNTLITEWCSEARSFRCLSSNVFQNR